MPSLLCPWGSWGLYAPGLNGADAVESGPVNRPIRVVLVRPRNPLNIGACARAMANFGLTDLVVLDPYEPVWQETRSAPDAEQVVLNARLASTWDDAVDPCDLVLGSSSFHQRPLEQSTIELPNLGRYLTAYPASTPLALVLGSERSGLSNEELVRCQAVIHIPTLKTTSSMNLGQATAVILYELRRTAWEPPTSVPLISDEMEVFLNTLAKAGQGVNYPAGATDTARLGRIRAALQGSVLSASAVRYLLSFTRAVMKLETKS